jgi:butyryl-CoA dehydrogenase
MSLLSSEHTMIRDMVREFARNTVAPGAEKRDRESLYPRDELAAMGDLGLLGMLAPEEWGGSGSGYLAFVLAIEEIAAADGALSTIMSVHNSLATTILLKYGTAEQKETWLRPLSRGKAIGAFALSEPQAGSDPAAIRTKAVRDGKNYNLTGTKQFVTSGKNGNVTIVFAVTDSAAGKKGISAFLVPTDTPGYKVARLEDKMGQKSSDTAQLVFEDMRIPASYLLGQEGQGYAIALSHLEGGRVGIAAQAVGMARAAYEAALKYSCERETFGQPIIKHQAIAFRLADMATQIEAARHLVHHAARLRDLEQPCRKEAFMAKLFATEMAEKVCREAIQIHGGYGYLTDFPVERIYRDVRVSLIYEGTSDIQRMVIAREIEKEAA